jgi:GNAT superfamily N-acetyltransferase
MSTGSHRDPVAPDAPCPLDNPVWSSLSGLHAGLADPPGMNGAQAGRYQRDVCPFGALDDPVDPRCWSALDDVLEGSAVALVVDPDQVPAGWEVVTVIEGVQMDGSRLRAADDPELVVLTQAEVPEMTALVERALPGPFLPRTIEMGTYLGLRRHGTLVAMAGERLRPAGWTEISAVCTDDAFRGQGIGTRLVRAVAANIGRRGDRPFLHATARNETAIRLYLSLGFELRRRVSFTIVRRQRD